MYVVNELKLNKFKPVRIPSNTEYFRRYGNAVPSEQQFSGDESIPAFQSKIDAIANEDLEYQNYLREHDLEHS